MYSPLLGRIKRCNDICLAGCHKGAGENTGLCKTHTHANYKNDHQCFQKSLIIKHHFRDMYTSVVIVAILTVHMK